MLSLKLCQNTTTTNDVKLLLYSSFNKKYMFWLATRETVNGL